VAERARGENWPLPEWAQDPVSSTKKKVSLLLFTIICFPARIFFLYFSRVLT
jgi:hypothetical protein